MSRRTAEELRPLLPDPGFWPGARDLPALLECLGDADDKTARGAERALLRLHGEKVDVTGAALARFGAATTAQRRGTVALVGSLVTGDRDPLLQDWLEDRLADADGPTRRRAIAALGRLGAPSDKALVSLLEKTSDAADRRALARALGRVDSPDARHALDGVKLDTGGDALLALRVSEGRLRGRRQVARQEPTRLLPERTLPKNTPVLLHVRAGLEPLLSDELATLDRRMGVETVGAGRVRIVGDRPVGELFRARTFLHLGFPLPPEMLAAASDQAVAQAVARALAGPTAREIFSALTDGPLRYRLGWTDGAKHKTATREAAILLTRAFPDAVNDPVDAPWHVFASVQTTGPARRVFVELWPRALPDPRFAYRKTTLPASSHPTVAAALARVAGVRADDVVWDPFAGAATELIERALLGKFRQLIGTDLDERAIAAARENLQAAGLNTFTLEKADATSYAVPQPPTLVITNPPFGRRVPVAAGAGNLIESVLANASRQLAPRGRMVLVMPRRIDAHALTARLQRKLVTHLDLDLGGVAATLVRIE